jgi:hypothetical protein
MSNLASARALAAITTAAVLALGTLAASGAANAHGMGMGHMSGPSMGTQSVNLSQTDHNLSIGDHGHDRSRLRRFRFIDVGFAAAPASTCFYKHTVWGLAKICPDLD